MTYEDYMTSQPMTDGQEMRDFFEEVNSMRFYIFEEDMLGSPYKVHERNKETGKYSPVIVTAKNALEAKQKFCKERDVYPEDEWLYTAHSVARVDKGEAQAKAFLKENGYKSWEEYDRDYESAHPARPIEL